MKLLRFFILTFVLSLLLACGSSEQHNPASQEDKEKTPSALPEHHQRALEQAKGVDQLLKSDEEEKKKQMEALGL